ncbi:MAG TPA: hypothetical protein VGN60_02780 [Devosia sp.]|jgi:hypothetical protein|nr:hypothetical protein [Devosia sp.]
MNHQNTLSDQLAEQVGEVLAEQLKTYAVFLGEAAGAGLRMRTIGVSGQPLNEPLLERASTALRNDLKKRLAGLSVRVDLSWAYLLRDAEVVDMLALHADAAMLGKYDALARGAA